LDTGISKSWYPSGKLLMETYVNKNTPFPKGAQLHIRDTNSTQWYENGQKMRETIDSFSRVIRHDTEWFDSGQIRRDENLKDGKVAIIEWDVNGNKVHELNMLITGQKISEIHYVNGVKSEE